ncbi:MAG TPA: hemin uptake protein HemP [Phycisphaerales bacterium]|nr:hemin uptake protein HemP [Phycisphaerales bacterium]
MNPRPPSTPAAAAPRRDPSFSETPLLDAKTMFGPWNEIRIAFGNEQYRLRITRNNKLILTK